MRRFLAWLAPARWLPEYVAAALVGAAIAWVVVTYCP